MGMRLSLSMLVLLLVTPAVSLAQQEIMHKDVQARWGKVHDRVASRILSRRPVRRLSQAAVRRLVTSPENTDQSQKGRALIKNLVTTARHSGARRGVRRGYTSNDVEYRGKGLAARLGLKTGQSIRWNTKGARLEVKAETSGRVVISSRRHDRYLGALRKEVYRVVDKVVKDPTYQPTAKEQQRLALAPTDLRAEALARKGYKLRREQRGKGLKYELEVKGEQGLKAFAKVFGPAVSTYLPGSGHSQYIHNGWVVDFMFTGREPLRPTNRTVYPVMLSGKEAGRMDKLTDAIINSGWYGAEPTQGNTNYTHGRPPGYWPPRPGIDKKTGNSCTTTHHRAPVGPRLKGFRWLDSLDRAGLVQGSLLTHLTKVSGATRIAKIDELLTSSSGEPRRQLKQLKGIVEQYNGMRMTEFPLDLLGRKQVKDLMGTPYDPRRKGTTDPVGPGFARPMYSGATERIPVVVRLKK
jgi:hypothetical protein